MVNLNTVNASATAEQKAAAEKAKPATEGLFDEDEKKPASVAAAAAAAPASSKVVPITAASKSGTAPVAAAAPAEKKGSGGLIAGAAIAIIGLAAGFAIMRMNKPEAPPPPVAAETTPKAPEAQPMAPAEPQPAGGAVAQAPSETAPSAQPDQVPAPSGGDSKVAQSGGPSNAGAAPQTSGAPAASPAPEPVAATEKPTGPATPATPSKPGDLAGAMAQAVGEDGQKKAPTSENAEPAAGARSQNIPEQPSQGSVQAAIGTVMGGAKACVAGADDVSRAQITFGSGGAVTGVSVTGWASSHGATGCIKGALQGAKVGPFSKSSYTVGVTIRP